MKKLIRAYGALLIVVVAVGVQSSVASAQPEPETTPAPQVTWEAGSTVNIDFAGDVHQFCAVGSNFGNLMTPMTSYSVGCYNQLEMKEVLQVRINGKMVSCFGDFIVPADPKNCR